MHNSTSRLWLTFALCGVSVSVAADDRAAALRKIQPDVFQPDESPRDLLGRMLSDGIRACNARSTADWRKLKSSSDWEDFSRERIARLRASLGGAAPQKQPVRVEVTGEIEADGFRIRNVLYESRPGLWITANLYSPAEPPKSAPGIIISHSHHSPKTQAELQDMGGLWARAGCYVLAPDHVGHGERRQHPYTSAEDYPGEFKHWRQDYYFRYNTAMQLYAAGDSLMSWMTQDLMRSVDLLLAQPGIDPKRIAIFGSVAGGGDPAAVTAALDDRITLLVPFNFGGPQPETRPLSDDADDAFNYAGGGSWESTRNLHRSASDGFLPWVIVASVAPRGLMHAHEFSWDREHDPVWKRYQQIFKWYDAGDQLDYTHGYGRLKLSSSEASHCNNIGPTHRQRMHAYLKRQWGIEVDSDRPVGRHESGELACLTETVAASRLKPLRQLAGKVAADRSDALTKSLAAQDDAQRLRALRSAWETALGGAQPYELHAVEDRGAQPAGDLRVQRLLLQGEGQVGLPLLLLVPNDRPKRLPVVLVLSQSGKSQILAQRSELLAALLKHAAVCLIDVRGTGETTTGSDRGRQSAATGRAATALMLGETLVGGRLRDARTALAYLRSRNEFSAVAVIGDSLAAANGPDVQLQRPLDVEQPTAAEPLGAALALLVGLFEDERTVVAARGGLASYASLYDSRFIHVPLDAIVPGAAALGDLPLVAKTAAQRQPVWLGGLVDALNQPVDASAAAELYGKLAHDDAGDEALARWVAAALSDSR